MKPVNDIAFQEPPVCIFKPARYKAFVRVARQMAKLHGPRPIQIQDSRIFQPLGHRFFWADIDLANILTPPAVEDNSSAKDAEVDMHGVSFRIQVTERDLRQLPAFAGAEWITVSGDGGELVFSDDHTEGRLFQPAPGVIHSAAHLPTDDDRIGEDVLIADRSALASYAAKAGFVTLRCFKGQLEQVSVRGKPPYTLHKNSAPWLKGRSPDLVLTSQNFLALAGGLELSLGIYHNDAGYWLKTSSKPSLINNLTTWECLYEGRV